MNATSGRMTEEKAGLAGVAAAEAARIKAFILLNAGREIVAVQGLGFVGTAMAAALARARSNDGEPIFGVIGVDLPDEAGSRKIAAVRNGLPPVVSSDELLMAAYREAHRAGNLTATADAAAFDVAQIVVIDVNLDVEKTSGPPLTYRLANSAFMLSLTTVADHIREDTLVLLETTVPPGTTERVAVPMLREGLKRRGLDPLRVQIAHSYERVMPGAAYLASITDYFRVFAGIDDRSRARTRDFLERFINTRDYPLFELASPSASELAKVLENSYRAANIALLQEWTEFAEAAGIDLFRIVEAIRVRPTHRNLMLPGFGVGGYCLTKDGLLADWAAQTYFGADRRLEISVRAVEINDAMPLHTLQLMRGLVPDLAGRRVLLMGVSYLPDVADTRSSPTAILYDACVAVGASVSVHDTLVAYWPEKGIAIDCRIGQLGADDSPEIVVFAVRHREYLALDAGAILRIFPSLIAVVDANDVVNETTATALAENGIAVVGVGKGHWRGLVRPPSAARAR